MLEYLKQEADCTHTENGAVTYASTQCACLDLFATIGALRGAEDAELQDRFVRAYTENPDLAMRLLFFARDIRGGIGERRVFRVMLKWLARHYPQSVEKNIKYIPVFGRFDDLLCLMGTPCERAALQSIEEQLNRDRAALETQGEVSLLAKWLPSVNASNADTVKQAKRIARALQMSDAAYRKLLTALRKKIRILENSLREKDYSFDYAKQPAKAMLQYRKAFLRNDAERYQAFLERVAQGKETLHTGTLTPYELIRPFFIGQVSGEERKAIDASWNALEDFTKRENALVVIDGSGSMYGWSQPTPATVALSLGIYFAERNQGRFHNHFITFSERPQLVEIKGTDIYDKVVYCSRFNEVANTNLQRVFELILNTAVKHHLPQEEMPSKLYIISDMEFDACICDGSLTNFRYAKKLFARHGYTLPEVVFWNVASRNRQQPVRQNEQGVALVSGASPRIFSMLQQGEFSPYAFMLSVLGAERYARIAA